MFNILDKWTTLSSANLMLHAVSLQHRAARICTVLEILAYLLMKRNSKSRKNTQMINSSLSILL